MKTKTTVTRVYTLTGAQNVYVCIECPDGRSHDELVCRIGTPMEAGIPDNIVDSLRKRAADQRRFIQQVQDNADILDAAADWLEKHHG